MSQICLPVIQNANPCKPSMCWWWDVALDRDALAEWGWGWCRAEISQFLQGCGIASTLCWQPRKTAAWASAAHTLAFLMLLTWAWQDGTSQWQAWGFCWQQLTLSTGNYSSAIEIQKWRIWTVTVGILLLGYFCAYPTGDQIVDQDW